MASTRAAVLRENRVQRREFLNSRDENIKPRTNSPNKIERNGNFHKEDHVKSYTKAAALPKRHLHSDLNAVNARKTTGESHDNQPEKATKTLEVNRKNSDQESKRLSVSKLKNIFDSIENEVQPLAKPPLKPRPKSTAVKIPSQPEPTINRWSVPTYVNNATSTQNYKIYVTEGIAAKRAKFEDRSSESLPVSLKEKGSSPKLSDLVPELTKDGIRSRTRSDPGIIHNYKNHKSLKQRSHSDVVISNDDHMLLLEKRHSFDDISIGKPRSFKRLSKSSSVDVLEVDDLQVTTAYSKNIPEEPHQSYQESSSLECSPTIEDINGDSSQKKDRIDSGISSSVESSAENGEEMLKPEEEEEQPLRSYQVKKSHSKPFPSGKEEKHHTSSYQPDKRVKDESLIYNRPGEVREAKWKEDAAPEEETKDNTAYLAADIKEKVNTKVNGNQMKHNDAAEISSDDDSTDSFVHRGSPEPDAHVPKEPFAFNNVPLVSAFSKKEPQKRGRNVIFACDEPRKWFTYSAEEYVRGNDEVDPVTASAEWELEKRVEKMDVFSVDLNKDERGLGLSIIGLGVGTDTGVEKLGIFIKSLTEGGAAEKDRRICVNDQIIEVDGVSLVGVTQIFAAQTLKNTSGTVRFLMGREKGKQLTTTKPVSSNEQTAKELQEVKTKLAKTEIRADRAEAKLRQMESKLETLTASSLNNSDLKTKHLEASLAHVNDKLKNAETDMAIAEAENADMLKQLEESKGMYLLLEKRYNALKIRNHEYEEKLDRQKKVSESNNDSFTQALQQRIKELEQEVKQLKTPKTDENKSSSKRVALTNGTSSKPQERYFSLEAEKFERMAAVHTENLVLDLDIIPSTKPLDNALNLDKKRVAEAQSKAHKPTRASWGCSLEEDFDIFKNGELEYNEEEDGKPIDGEPPKAERPKHFNQAFALPGFPAGGFKLKQTGRSLMDNSPNEGESSPQQELRSSYPLAIKEKSQNVVVENLLEKQLKKGNQGKIASLPSAIDQEGNRLNRRNKDSDEFLGSSGNSLDEIEEAARRIDSDLASSQASSRGSSPFLPPAMPLLKMKTVPVSDSQFNEAAIDVPAEISTDSESDPNISSPVSFSPTSDISPSIGSGSSRLSNAWLSRPVQEWDSQQVCLWLTGLGLEECTILFSNKRIDGEQLLNLDSSKMKSMGVEQNARSRLKKKIKELKAQTEREGKIKRPKEQKPSRKETSPTPFQDKFEKLGFMKKGKYTVN